MISLVGPINSGAAVGGAGVATSTGQTSIAISGYVDAVYVKYNDAPPAGTTDILIATKGTTPNPPARTILAVANAATDGWFVPRADSHNASTGAALTKNESRISILDIVTVKIDQANAADNIDVWLLIGEE